MLLAGIKIGIPPKIRLRKIWEGHARYFPKSHAGLRDSLCSKNTYHPRDNFGTLCLLVGSDIDQKWTVQQIREIIQGGLIITQSTYFTIFLDAFCNFLLLAFAIWQLRLSFLTLVLGHFSSCCMLVQKRNFTKYCESLQYLITILGNPLIIVQHYEEGAA